MDNRSSIAHFMKALQSLFVSVRCCPDNSCSLKLLYMFRKYLAKTSEIDIKEIARIKGEISEISSEHDFITNELINELDVYKSDLCIDSVDKIIENTGALTEIIDNFQILYDNKEFERIRELADAVHNFPEMLISDIWSYDDYWKMYIKPYRDKWDKTFLDNWSKKPKDGSFFVRFLNQFRG